MIPSETQNRCSGGAESTGSKDPSYISDTQAPRLHEMPKPNSDGFGRFGHLKRPRNVKAHEAAMSLRQEIHALLLAHPLARLTAKAIAPKLSRAVALRTVAWHLAAIRAGDTLQSRQSNESDAQATVGAEAP